MRRRASTEVPRALDLARREIEQWRGRQSGRRRVPREFWAKAMALAEEYGVHRTAHTLGLQYASLRQHLAAKTDDPAQAPAARYQFLELRPGPLTASSLTCTIELEAILARAKTAPMSEEEYVKLHAAIETLVFLTGELEKKHVSIQKLKQLLFGAPTESTRQVIPVRIVRKVRSTRVSHRPRWSGSAARRPWGHGL